MSEYRDTQQDAFRKIKNLGGLHRAILDVLTQATEGYTFYEMSEILGIDSRRIQPRMSELAKMGRIIDSGRRTETPFGRKGIAWKLPEGQT